MKLLKHLKTIRVHRKYVRKLCFKMGIPIQGITHDLSKYSLTELSICKYYSGTKSPHQNCRYLLGYSPSWNHHKRFNKHHWQYWLDDDEDGNFIGIKIPYKYVIEMFCDMVGAGQTYMKDTWNQSSPLEYWIKHCKGKRIMNKYSEDWLFYLILKLDHLGLAEFLKRYKLNKKRFKLNYESNKPIDITYSEPFSFEIKKGDLI